MHQTKYNIFVDGECVAKEVTLEYAMIFQKAMFDKFYLEKELEISIKRIPEPEEDGETCDNPFVKG